ncbi:MAG: VOC family protein [Myxococcales bacterium]|nr:VOC family protein [Myxococcales bacterium]
MGNAFVHTELSVDDVAAAKKFYKGLFDWKLDDLGPEMGNYVMIDLGSKTSGGGITGKMSPTQPTAWLSYVEVASVKATMAKAEKAGATVVVDYQEIGTMGAIGVFLDPQGAALGLWEKGKPAAKKPAAKKPAAKKPAAKKPAKRK